MDTEKKDEETMEEGREVIEGRGNDSMETFLFWESRVMVSRVRILNVTSLIRWAFCQDPFHTQEVLMDCVAVKSDKKKNVYSFKC